MKWIRTIIYLGLMCGILCFLCGCQKEVPVFISASQAEESAETDETVQDGSQEKAAESAQVDAAIVEQQSESEDVVCVYVCGAVGQSGVYTLTEGSRVYEAIAAAGGLRDDADEYYVNQAQLLTDGMQIIVPVKGETVQGTASTGSSESKINLNQASEQELQTLTGIGEVKAAAIVAYREAHGHFTSIEEIQNVDGISEKLYEKIKEQIIV